MKILHVVGARPNFMKMAPIIREMAQLPQIFEQNLIHTGQHYDENMSKVFFEQLELPKPDINLEVGSGSHAWQTAQIMMKFESIVKQYSPDWVFVPGDVNSTLACSLVCSKLGIRIAHVEAGLRSFDRNMPEEINRIVTDQLADLLLTPSEDANQNLINEGVNPYRIRFVGNVMIDTLVRLLPKALDVWPQLYNRFGQKRYLLVTLHRPSNVDNSNTLHEIMLALGEISSDIAVVFPVHPRTQRYLQETNLVSQKTNLKLVEPLGYLDFLSLEAHASAVLTDSGGVQEETTYLNVPCLTIRDNTERPITLTQGSNQLIASDHRTIIQKVQEALNRVSQPDGNVIRRPPLWDGVSAKRIVEVMYEFI